MEAVVKPRKRPKGIEEVVQYALGHRIRVRCLIILNDGIRSAAEISEMIGEPLNNVANHLRKMLDDGSIEIAKEERKRNVTQYWYRAVEIKEYSDEEAAAMPELHRRVTVGAILQSGFAEVLAALYGGTLSDPRSALYWSRYNVDQEGREKLEALTARYLEDLREIEVEATNRRAESGEDAVPMMANVAVFERAETP